MDLSPLYLSIKLSLVATSILLIIGTPIAWFLSQRQDKIKSVIEAIILLPLLLPPTILGFYLLVILGPNSLIGSWWKSLTNQSLTFSFTGLVIGSIIYSLPFVVRPIQNSFESINKHWLEVASTLGASSRDRFFSIAFKMAKSGFISAIVLGFTHTMGEFGVVLMLGGNIPNKTKTISIAIYDYVELLEYDKAHILSLILLILSLCSLVMLFIFSNNKAYAK